jgi:hypothetical protein
VAVERIWVLQVPGESLHRKGESQYRLDKPSRRCSFIAHQRDGVAGEHASVAHGEVELVGGNGVVTRVIEVSHAERSISCYLVPTVELLPQPRHREVPAPRFEERFLSQRQFPADQGGSHVPENSGKVFHDRPGRLPGA